MDSGSGDRRRRRVSRHRSRKKKPGPKSGPLSHPKRPAEASKSSSKKKRSVRPTSSFSAPRPSTAPLALKAKKPDPPVWLSYVLGLSAVTLLILLGGGHNLFALGLSLLIPGVALLISPPKHSPGVWLDRTAVAFLACCLLAFIPQFYWPDPEWRKVASESFDLSLPWSLSVQPMISFEAWLCALAGFAWLYAAFSWPINDNGRKWLYFVISCVVGVLAGVVFFGNLTGSKYPAAESSQVFTFFPNRNQTANVLALGSVAAFAYAMTSLRSRQFAPIIGVPVAAVCLAALIGGHARAGVFLFFSGIFLWYLLQLRSSTAPRFLKVGFPLVLLAFSLFISSNARTTERVMDFIAAPSEWSGGFRGLIYSDSVDMIQDAPISGFGLGTFSAIFPQYRDQSASFQRAIHPESDFFWLASETGILGLVLFAGFLLAYTFRCRGLTKGQSGAYRLIAAVAVVLFLIHALVDVPGHRPGTVYFAILFAALALPRPKIDVPAFKPVIWRWTGGVLVVFSMVWFFAALTGLPLHSSKAIERYEKRVNESISVGDYENGLLALEHWLKWRPLDWRAHFQHGMLTLSDSGARADAAADFRRARFAEPTLGVVTYEEGYVWLPYDVGRTLSAWRETLFRESDNVDSVFERMIRAARNNPKLMDGLSRISELDNDYRYIFLTKQKDQRLMLELKRELAKEPALGHFSREQRTRIVEQWVMYGDPQAAEEFLERHSIGLTRPWWLWSLLRKNQAQFKEATEYILQGTSPPGIPLVQVGQDRMKRLVREFSVAPTDVMKGTALMQIHIENQDYAAIAAVTEAMIEARNNVPPYVLYWKGQSLYQLEDYIESWYAFEEYFKKLWEL